MSVKKVWVDADVPVVVVEEGGQEIELPLDRQRWLLGPLYFRTSEPEDPRVPESESVLTRIAANDLIAASDQHEREDHDGLPCAENRAGIVAFVAHSLGLGTVNLPLIGDALAEYERHHHHHG